MHNLIAHCSQIVDFVTVFLFLLPESEVLLEQFDDALGVTEVVFFKLVNLVESFLEGFVSELTGGLVVLHDFVVEDGEVQGETELDGVAGRKCNLVGLVVSLECFLLNLFQIVTLGILRNVAEVVTDHLDEKGFWFSTARFVEDLLVDHVDDVLTILVKFGLNLALVVGESF